MCPGWRVSNMVEALSERLDWRKVCAASPRPPLTVG